MLSLAAIAVLVLHPQAINPKSSLRNGNGIPLSDNDLDQDLLAILPTPLSAEIHEEPQALPMSEISPGSSQGVRPSSDSSSKLLYGSFVYKDWFGEHSSPERHVTYRKNKFDFSIDCSSIYYLIFVIVCRGFKYQHRCQFLHIRHHSSHDLWSC